MTEELQEQGAPEASQVESDTIKAVQKAEPDDENEENNGHHHHHHHSEEFHFYSRPRQRQKWGECKILGRDFGF